MTIQAVSKPRYRIRESLSRRIFLKLNVVILLFLCFLMLYPVVYVIASSFSEETAILRGDVAFLPVGFHTKAYSKVFNYPQLWTSYRNTVVYTLLGTAVNLLLTVCGAWALSQKKMPGRRFLTLMCTFTMFFSGGMIPTFLVVKELKLLNTIWAMILPCAVSTYNMILMRTFFLAIPTSLVEAAELDGCTPNQMFWKITIPLIRPILVYVMITSMIGGLQMFDVPQILTNGKGGPDRTSTTMIMYLNNHLFSKNYGMAGAVSVVLFLVCAVLCVVVYFSLTKEDDGLTKAQRKELKAAKKAAAKGGK